MNQINTCCNPGTEKEPIIHSFRMTVIIAQGRKEGRLTKTILYPDDEITELSDVLVHWISTFCGIENCSHIMLVVVHMMHYHASEDKKGGIYFCQGIGSKQLPIGISYESNLTPQRIIEVWTEKSGEWKKETKVKVYWEKSEGHGGVPYAKETTMVSEKIPTNPSAIAKMARELEKKLNIFPDEIILMEIGDITWEKTDKGWKV